MWHLNKINLLFKKKSLFYCLSCNSSQFTGPNVLWIQIPNFLDCSYGKWGLNDSSDIKEKGLKAKTYGVIMMIIVQRSLVHPFAILSIQMRQQMQKDPLWQNL